MKLTHYYVALFGVLIMFSATWFMSPINNLRSPLLAGGAIVTVIGMMLSANE